jgi:glycosyltransferase involved in cell wall biosynthesis
VKDGTISIAIDGMLLGGSFSGVEESILGLAQSLAAKGKHKYRLYLPHSAACPDVQGSSFASERVHIAASRVMRMLWEQRTLPRILKSGEFDLIHAPAYLAPLASPIPVVLTVYDLQTLLFPEYCMPLNRINYRIMLPRSIRKASGIIVPSESVARDVAKLVPDATAKLKVIPLGLNPVFRVIDRAECSSTLQRLGIDEPFILFAGNMARNKNLPMLIRSFAILKREHSISHKLVLAGRNGSEDQKIRDEINKQGLSDEVICTGYVPEVDLVALYNAADLFLFPSLYEGFGLTPLEAMACGTPVVCSQIDALKETTGSAARLVDPHDPTAIASGMLALIRDRTAYEQLKGKGLDRVKAFDRADAMLQTEAFYEKITPSE